MSQEIGVRARPSSIQSMLSDSPPGPQHPCVTLGNLLNFSVPSFLICHTGGRQWPRHKGVVRFQEVNVCKIFEQPLVQGRRSVNAGVLVVPLFVRRCLGHESR